MIFGRKKKAEQADEVEEVEELDELEDDEDEADEAAEDDAEQNEYAKWDELDSQDWREDGPFDITEVDLDADEVDRMDFGALVITPFEGMKLQLQVDQSSQQVQAVLAMFEQSGIEVSLFAAPTGSSMLPEIRGEMLNATAAAGGDVTLVEGPFGTEIRRVIPLTNAEGQSMYHVSRTWFAQGPKWLLRGVLMGEAGMSEEITGSTEVLFEFFSNIVVRRGSAPMVPGNLIPMDIPEGLLTNNA